MGIFLRKSGNSNKFREVILRSLRAPYIDNALLCSGFFQEDVHYSAGTEFAISSHRGHCPLTVTTLGIYSYSWKKKYSDFVAQLRQTNYPCCFSAVQMRIPRMSWHAKVFIAKQEKEPRIAIIGSSNITSRAFGISSTNRFNYECDVVFWDENNAQVNAMVEGVILGDEVRREAGTPDVIVATYDEAHLANRNLPLRDRLISLEGEILSLALPM
jgi:phosphatidylserine/phosphatidylglycerophosphate/cardiolipin synthase-like enzyme